MSSDQELLNIFYIEVREYLEALNAQMLQVETTTSVNRQPLLREMNRVAHSMKGAARAVGIGVIETISHYMEEVFGAALDKDLPLTPAICDVMYDGLDLIQNTVDGSEPDTETLGRVLAQLEQIVATTASSEANGSPPTLLSTVAIEPPKRTTTAEIRTVPSLTAPLSPTATNPLLNAAPVDDNATGQTMMLRPAEETIRVTVSKLDQLMAEASELLVARMHVEERQRQVNLLRRVLNRWQREWRSVRAAYIRLARRMHDQDKEMVAELGTMFKFLEANQRYLTETIRALAHLSQSVVQDNMHLSTLADQLQEDISGMRMIPFESIVGGFQRMVRDLARDLNKQIQLDVSSTAVELDKTVLDALKDPIMHLLRNAIDHGIGTPEEREMMGKPPVGHIELSVDQRGSEITVRVADDGKGIDPVKVRKSAVKAGLLSESEISTLSDDEARLLIFQPGFTTSDRVTAVSGRGLGMDIVRDRVEAMRGRVSIQSVVGRGTIVSLSVPVSLTRIRCIMLRVGGEEYAVPSAMVLRMEKLSRTSIFTAEGRDVVMVNEHPTPLVSMGALLDSPTIQNEESLLSVLVLRAADRSVAFEVDDLYSEQELVLKPLGTEIARARYVAGAALLGSGNVVIVLDANDLVRGATGVSLPRRRTRMDVPIITQRRLRILVADDSITTRTLEKNILDTAGFDVMVAIDGVEALQMLHESDFDVVISDVEMPNMNGLELTARIKDHPHTRDIPVILLTSLGKPEQREAGLRAGADAYLVKSRFDQGELLKTIQDVL